MRLSRSGRQFPLPGRLFHAVWNHIKISVCPISYLIYYMDGTLFASGYVRSPRRSKIHPKKLIESEGEAKSARSRCARMAALSHRSAPLPHPEKHYNQLPLSHYSGSLHCLCISEISHFLCAVAGYLSGVGQLWRCFIDSPHPPRTWNLLKRPKIPACYIFLALGKGLEQH